MVFFSLTGKYNTYAPIGLNTWPHPPPFVYLSICFWSKDHCQKDPKLVKATCKQHISNTFPVTWKLSSSKNEIKSAGSTPRSWNKIKKSRFKLNNRYLWRAEVALPYWVRVIISERRQKTYYFKKYIIKYAWTTIYRTH